MKVLLDRVHAAPIVRGIPPHLKRRLKAALRELGKDPTGTTNRLDVKRLDSGPGAPMFRLRVGDWRIAYTFDKAVLVLRVFPRGEGYGWLTEMD